MLPETNSGAHDREEWMLTNEDASPLSRVSVSGYQQTTWGMSLRQVRRLNSSGIVTPQGALVVLDTRVANLSAAAMYSFDSGRLVSVLVDAAPKGFPGRTSLDVYKRLALLLAEKYGPATFADEAWHDESMRSREPVPMGFALDAGFLELTSYWRRGLTSISLRASECSLRTCVTIRYTGINFMRDAETQDRMKALRDL